MSRELNKTREELAALFLAALEEERLPWHQPWLNHGPGLGASVNAVTGKAYRSTKPKKRPSWAWQCEGEVYEKV